MRFKPGDIITPISHKDRLYRVELITGNHYCCLQVTSPAKVYSEDRKDGHQMIAFEEIDEFTFDLYDHGFNEDLEKILKED